MFEFLLGTPNVLIVLFLLLGLTFWRFSTPTLRFPPGPPSSWFIGNILSLPTKSAWISLTQLGSKYGDLVCFRGLGTTILVLNSMEAINDLLDRRASIYSHRPIFTFLGEIMGVDQGIPMLQHGPEWRLQRKLAASGLNSTAVRRYIPLQEDLAALLAKKLLDSPERFFSHVRLTAGRIVVGVAYGFPISEIDSMYIDQAEQTMELVGRATVPGAFLCDFFPILKYLPSWVPFRRLGAYGNRMVSTLVSSPFDHVKRNIVQGIASPSITEQLLRSEMFENTAEREHHIKWSMGSLYGAGAETTYATTLIFMMAMALHPEAQHKAQAEIDRVVGHNKIPRIDDASRLPYVGALIKEVMRWHPVLPLSIARRTAEADQYRGFDVPRDTIIIPNVWAIAFKPCSKYDVKSFIPERFLDEEVKVDDPALWAFGFGRRICPGKALAENSIFALISSILAQFEISPIEGHSINQDFGKNLVSYPEPFEVRIAARSMEAVDLIQARSVSCFCL
ncbi:cytochrome P450 [Mycena metata]|uniref:Cytochrome P450 n=1 Tax=Mycena metata TaxID=1033252 RepID=A0AAD7JHD7_9AGAR|nr:cytochrome P450 [Mycena metata]